MTQAQIRRLLAAAQQLPVKRWKLWPKTFHTLLLVLYSTGLRISEALQLRLCDVDLENRTLFIAETKFFKSRWVPFTSDLAQWLQLYREQRTTAEIGVSKPRDPFFVSAHRRAYSLVGASEVFHQIVKMAGVRIGSRASPRLFHTFRHSFACQRLLLWYRAGEDLEAKLPRLATYMGHVNISSTEVYLTETTLLLREAGNRFENDFGSLITPNQPTSDAT